jgi:hypothetical protein
MAYGVVFASLSESSKISMGYFLVAAGQTGEAARDRQVFGGSGYGGERQGHH